MKWKEVNPFAEEQNSEVEAASSLLGFNFTWFGSLDPWPSAHPGLHHV